MTFRLSWHYIAPLILAVGLLVGTVLLWSIKFPYWGQAHLYHTDKPQLPLSSKIGYRQHVVFEQEEVMGIILSFEPVLPAEGGVIVHVRTQDGRSSSGSAQFASATSLGDIYVPISGIRTDRFSDGDIIIASVGTTKQVKLRYEIDSEKYAEGALVRLYTQRQEEKVIGGGYSVHIGISSASFLCYSYFRIILDWFCACSCMCAIVVLAYTCFSQPCSTGSMVTQ